MKTQIQNSVKTCIVIKSLIVLIFLLQCFEGSSQRSYQENRFYASKGGSDVICGNTYNLTKWNSSGSWIETWQNCRRRVWHQEYYSGFVYYWGANGWYREWKEGNFWYFNWYDYPIRIS